jgi:hypothetical protein
MAYYLVFQESDTSNICNFCSKKNSEYQLVLLPFEKVFNVCTDCSDLHQDDRETFSQKTDTLDTIQFKVVSYSFLESM